MASREAFAGRLSPFRSGFLKVELLIGGSWVDVTADLGDDGVRIKRGREDEQSQPGPAEASFRLKNGDGKYSPRNPRSPYFGLLGRNTQVRVSTQPTAGGTVTYRFWGEVAEWPQRWTRKGAPSAYALLTCAGLTRRLNQGASPLRSTLVRTIRAIGSNLVAYWPMEDGSDASSFAPEVGARAITWDGDLFQPAGYEGFRGSEALPMIGTAHLSAKPPAWAPTGFAQVRWLTAIPLSTPNGAVLLRASASGTLGWVDVKYSTGGGLTIEGYGDGGNLLASNTFGFSLDGTKKIRVSLELTQSGGNISWALGVYQVGATGGSFGSGTWTGATIGYVTGVDVNPGNADLAGMPVGHLTVEKAITSLFAVSSQVMNGYFGETAVARMTRLCAENGVPFGTVTNGSSTALGAQGTDTLVNLLRQAAESDGGVLLESRASYALVYVARDWLHLTWRTPLVIPYQDNLLRPFEPTDDDQATRNDVTVERIGGSSTRAVQATGPMGTATIGTYDDAVQLSLQTDAQTERQAWWRLALGTVDEARWPVIGVDLADDPWLTDTAARDALLNAGVGTWLEVTQLPDWLPPFDVHALVQGVQEVIAPHSWTLEFNTAPASPYRVAMFGNGTRYSGAGTKLAAALNSTAASFQVALPDSVTWSTADGSVPLLIGGEVMTLTSVGTPSGGLQTFNVTRSVNGVVKSHAVDTPVALLEPYVYPLEG